MPARHTILLSLWLNIMRVCTAVDCDIVIAVATLAWTLAAPFGVVTGREVIIAHLELHDFGAFRSP